MNLDQVQKHFEEEAFEYDELILRIISKYLEQNTVLLSLLPFDENEEIKAIDLGCGTEILSYVILNAYPKAKDIAFDLVENMLEVCKKKLSRYGKRLSVMKGNFAKDDFGDGYDIAISGLASHHLSDHEKPELYKHVF
jgi:tRNA (cmo5U34)-methyltransferase